APRFNVTSVVWRPSDRATAHNHETWGVIGVIENEIEETRYRVTDTGTGRAKLEVTSVTRHRPGGVSCLVPGGEGHAMYNPPARDTIEIHVYGKDLVGLKRRRWDDDGVEKPLVSDKYLNCWRATPSRSSSISRRPGAAPVVRERSRSGSPPAPTMATPRVRPRPVI